MLNFLLVLMLLLSTTPVLAVGQTPSASQFNSLGNHVFAASTDISLGKDTYRGVAAMAYLKPMPDIPGGETYLLTVVFSAVDNGRKLTEGDVAVKITSSNGKTAAPLRLNPVAGSFQAELQLSMDGESQVTIGSKLGDEKKRIYRFFFTPNR